MPEEKPNTGSDGFCVPVKGVRGKPWTNIGKLARDYSEEAMEQLVKLMYDGNGCVALGATKELLWRGHGRVPPGVPKRDAKSPATREAMKVVIRRFNEERGDEGSARHHDLPVVYGGWQGPRDLGDAGGAGLPAVRGKRKGVRKRP